MEWCRSASEGAMSSSVCVVVSSRAGKSEVSFAFVEGRVLRRRCIVFTMCIEEECMGGKTFHFVAVGKLFGSALRSLSCTGRLTYREDG